MTLGSILLLANLMTDESRKIYRTNKHSVIDELEGTIKLKYKTIEALKELSNTDNSQTYDQIIISLIRSYNKKNADRQ